MTFETFLVAAVLSALIVFGIVWIRITRSRRLRAAAEIASGARTAESEVSKAEVSLVTEVLDTSRADELLQNALPLDPRSQLGNHIANIAGPALQAGLDVSAASALKGRYLVEFSAEGTHGVKTGVAALLRRVDGRLQPTLINTGARIQENAVVAAKAARLAASVAAITHTVVLLAVQAQLVTMERQLQRIEGKLDSLRRFLDETQLARVRGWLRKLAALRDEMTASSSWTDHDVHRWLAVLDAADADFLQVEEFGKAQCTDATAKVKSLPLRVWFLSPSGDSLLDEFLREVDRFRQYDELYGYTILGRLVIAHVKALLGKPAGGDQFEADIASLEEAADAHHNLLEQRVQEFRTFFRTKKYETAKRNVVLEAASDSRQRTDAALRRLRAAAVPLRTRHNSQRVVVEVDEQGNVRPLAVVSTDSPANNALQRTGA